MKSFVRPGRFRDIGVPLPPGTESLLFVAAPHAVRSSVRILGCHEETAFGDFKREERQP